MPAPAWNDFLLRVTGLDNADALDAGGVAAQDGLFQIDRYGSSEQLLEHRF